MGRHKREVDNTKILSLRADGKSSEQISTELDVSASTLTRRLRLLRFNEGAITKYRELHHLRITELSARLLDDLEAELHMLTPEQKIKLLGVLSRESFKLKEKEPDKVSGLMAHLTYMEEIEKGKDD